MKRPVTKDSVFKIEPYRSILNLLSIFQKHKGGMEQKHFRYALIHNHDLRTPQNKEGLDKWAIAECEGFFGNSIQFLVKSGLIKENCITSRNNLNGFLNRLLELKVVERDKNSRYKIEKNIENECERIRCIDIINSYTPNHLIVANFNGIYSHLMFGFDDDELISDKDLRDLIEYLKNIEVALKSIESLRIIYAFRLYINRIKEIVKDFGNENFKTLISHPYTCLAYYYGDYFGMDDELFEYVWDKRVKLPDECDDEISLEYTGFLYDMDDERIFQNTWGLTLDEFHKVDKLIKKEMNTISELLGNAPYVYYPKFGKNIYEKDVEGILQILKGSG